MQSLRSCRRVGGDIGQLPTKANLNNLTAFARSIRRAAEFKELRPILRTVQLSDDETVTEEHRHREHEDESPTEAGPEEERDDTQFPGRMRDMTEGSPVNEQTALLRNDKSSDQEEGTCTMPLSQKLHKDSHGRVQELSRQREESRAKQKDEEREPLLIKKVHRDDGTEAEVIVGQSTLPQTIFNSSNVLIGVGMLSLPLGIRYAGWVIGLGSLVASAFVTKYTASLLAKCLDVDSSLANFADIAYIAYGEKGRFMTSALFTLELMAACVSLVILFADSLKSLIDGPDDVHWKILCGCILAPLNFLPMRWLSFTSFLGIFCGLLLILITFIAGFLRSTSPGSLIDVSTTYALPEHWRALPLSFGLIMAVWGGHSVFPNIYRDMRHLHKYGGGLNVIFSFVTSVDLAMAIIGYLMYGNETKDEISTNVLTTEGYPEAVSISVLILIAIVPLTKFPLNCSPIVSTLEVISGIDPRAATIKPNKFNQSPFLSKALKAVFRIGVTVVTVIIAIAVPSFEVISAIMGAAFCFLICVILPLVFHLKMFQGQISRRQVMLDWTLIVTSVILGIAGTVWEFLPRGWMRL